MPFLRFLTVSAYVEGYFLLALKPIKDLDRRIEQDKNRGLFAFIIEARGDD